MILVTSANGNQGKRLVPKLLAAGHDSERIEPRAVAPALREMLRRYAEFLPGNDPVHTWPVA